MNDTVNNVQIDSSKTISDSLIKMSIVKSHILPNFYSFRLHDVNGKVTYRTIVRDDGVFMIDEWNEEYSGFLHIGEF